MSQVKEAEEMKSTESGSRQRFALKDDSLFSRRVLIEITSGKTQKIKND